MKEALPNLLKFFGALAVTTAIFFALSPEDKIDDEVLNHAMEFLGAKLLAMAPQEQKSRVEKEFEQFHQQAREGKISDRHFKDVAVAILNAEAEGKKFDREQIDSLLASIREAESEIAQAEAKVKKEESKIARREELIALSAQVQDFAKFEKEWKKMIPVLASSDSTLPPAPPPFYRINPNFVIEVDTAAIAIIATEHAKIFAGKMTKAVVAPPHEVNQALKDLARELPRLKIEMRQRHWHPTDSIGRAVVGNRRFYNFSRTRDTQMSDSMKKAIKEMRQQQAQQARLYRRMADSTQKAAEIYHRQHPTPPPPPGTPEEPKPKKREPPR
ncbi:MAG: hypothetical protein ONB46_17540 [candidate division KSB1 bacterium]|nr:hypothetical protein [candidate division KSB1 bacterium]MDZ7367592.1 hypothetical protein [candidate division KSB1 bacterium]MDZ7405384.1 hypothetical protein [candidate division KSB1 bacterium]